ncbi:ly-6/neurotoxin-like protein 1 [Alexandromys fortis]|nr:ly-6/neurotoxin-like protein 1 [Microtus fortis]
MELCLGQASSVWPASEEALGLLYPSETKNSSRARACPVPPCPASSQAWVGSRTSCSVPRCPHISIMTSLLTVLLVVLVGLPVAQALECHVCAYNGDNCFKPMRCPAMATYCMTTRTYFTPYRMKVRKSCVPSCFETVYDGYSKHASATSCCQYYLCNGAGFPTPVTLALVPVLLATFWSLL